MPEEMGEAGRRVALGVLEEETEGEVTVDEGAEEEEVNVEVLQWRGH